MEAVKVEKGNKIKLHRAKLSELSRQATELWEKELNEMIDRGEIKEMIYLHA